MTMMGTNFSQQTVHVIPMSTKKVDDMEAIWFLSDKDIKYSAHIKNKGRVQLIYSKPKTMELMTFYGGAYFRTDEYILINLYEKNDNARFKGYDDSNLTAILIKPIEGHYWVTKNNSFVSLFEAGMTVISRDQPDLGVEGDIRI